MSLNMKSLTQALAKTAAVIEKTVQSTVQEVIGPRPLQDYDLLDQVGSGGPGLAWKLYAARPRVSAPSTQYPLVCVWLLDKRSLAETRTRAGLSKAAEDGFLDIIRADASRLVRIRHPGVVHVVQALDESKNAMAMVTEPLFASVANTLGILDNVQKVPKEINGMEMGLLEVKHGLLQIAESLDFLHNNARLIHRAISPETVFVTSSGAWKLGGFGFAIPVDEASTGLTSIQTFHYSEYDVEDSFLPLQPSLNYTAPELVRNKSNMLGCSTDMFSFGCLAYHLIARKSLLDCHNNVKMFMNSLTYLSSEAFSAIPSELTGDLQRMLSMNEASRPSALEFTGSSFFRDDARLRALRFLDHMLERDNMQKSEFLKALSDMWKDFDSRVLRYKVLPPLCSELRNMVMQPMILPMVLMIAKSQDKNDFELSTLPALVPVLTSASGETLLLLLKHADLIINKVNQEHLLSFVLPLLVRAYDDNDPRIQEEVLRRTIPLARQLEMQLVKQAILPRVHGLALKTTVSAVRVNALRCLGDLVPSLDKQSVLDILQTLQRCTAVDRSAPTLMFSLGVSHAIFKQYGLEFAAEHVLPLLFPLLTAQQLSVQQFAKYILFIKDILREIEEKRGVTLSEAGTPEVRVSPSLSNGLHSELNQKPNGPVPAAKSSFSSWDEDWGPINRGNVPTSNPSGSSVPHWQSVPSSQTISPTLSFQSSSLTMNQQTSACPPVDVQWPPPISSGSLLAKSTTDSKQNHDAGGPSDSAFDDIDPFANWPPRPNNSVSSVVFPNKPSNSHDFTSSNSSNFAFESIDNLSVSKTFEGTSASNTNSQNSMNAIAFSSASQAAMAPGYGNADPLFGMGYSKSSGGQSLSKRSSDIGSIFASSNSNNPTPRIAPPPPSAIGRGRGRNHGSKNLSEASRSLSQSDQPPLLDLL